MEGRNLNLEGSRLHTALWGRDAWGRGGRSDCTSAYAFAAAAGVGDTKSWRQSSADAREGGKGQNHLEENLISEGSITHHSPRGKRGREGETWNG